MLTDSDVVGAHDAALQSGLMKSMFTNVSNCLSVYITADDEDGAGGKKGKTRNKGNKSKGGIGKAGDKSVKTSDTGKAKKAESAVKSKKVALGMSTPSQQEVIAGFFEGKGSLEDAAPGTAAGESLEAF